MVNFQGSILDSLLANYVKAHSHIIYNFLRFPKQQHYFCFWTGKNEEDVFIELVFRFILYSLLNKPFVVITSVSFLHQMSEKYWKSYFEPKLFWKTFHNIIVKMSKLASLHGVKKKVSGKLDEQSKSVTWNSTSILLTTFWRKKIMFV